MRPVDMLQHVWSDTAPGGDERWFVPRYATANDTIRGVIVRPMNRVAAVAGHREIPIAVLTAVWTPHEIEPDDD